MSDAVESPWLGLLPSGAQVLGLGLPRHRLRSCRQGRGRILAEGRWLRRLGGRGGVSLGRSRLLLRRCSSRCLGQLSVDFCQSRNEENVQDTLASVPSEKTRRGGKGGREGRVLTGATQPPQMSDSSVSSQRKSLAQLRLPGRKQPLNHVRRD